MNYILPIFNTWGENLNDGSAGLKNYSDLLILDVDFVFVPGLGSNLRTINIVVQFNEPPCVLLYFVNMPV